MPRVDVVFSTFGVTERDGWLTRLIARVVRWHVWAIVWYGDESYLVDPTWDGLRIAPMDPVTLRQYLRNSDVVETRQCEMEVQDLKFPLLEPMTCVTIVKRIIGIRNPWVLTPKQLLRAIDGKRN